MADAVSTFVVPQGQRAREIRSWLAAAEVPVVFAGVMAYIWRWQHPYPYAWIPLWAAILASHVLHHDNWRTLGLGVKGMRATAQWVLPITIAFCLPLLAWGFAGHHLELLRPGWRALNPLVLYGIWCALQQYLTQSYFHLRIMQVIPNRHLSSLVVAVMFSAAHIPNLILMVACLIAGAIFGEIFARYRNIWPLALAQAVGGLLIAAISPSALIHHMRVGPGYFFYGIR